MKKYLTATISPSMIPSSLRGLAILEIFEIEEFTFGRQVKKYRDEVIPAVGHENTARFLEKRLALLNTNLFSRVNVTLEPGDIVYAAIPQVRLPEATEFSDEQIQSAPFRFFVGELRPTKAWEILHNNDSEAERRWKRKVKERAAKKREAVVMKKAKARATESNEEGN